MHASKNKMAMKEKTSIFLALLSSLVCVLYASAYEAIPVITVKENQRNGDAKFVLNPEAIHLIEQLPSPVTVIAAIGDAKSGKSTTLNFIFHSISNDGITDNEYVEEVFKTGNTMGTTTRGVWMSATQIHRGNDIWQSLIVLDVEGTDIEDDTVTDKLSMFATLLSSSLLVFMKEHPTNHITDFVYKIARTSGMTFNEGDTKYLPHLMVIIRGALDPPQGYTIIDDYVKDSLTKPPWFRKEDMTVVNLPFDPTLTSHKYQDSIKFLAGKLMDLPHKKISNKSLPGTWEKIKDQTLKFVNGKTIDNLNFMLGKIGTIFFNGHHPPVGAESEIVDGMELVDFAERIVKKINEEHNSKGTISHNFYDLFENEICSKTFNAEIKPLLDATQANKISTQERWTKISQFKKCCILQQRAKTATDILNSCDQQCQLNWNGLHWYIWLLGMTIFSAFTGIVCIRFVLPSLLSLASDVQLKNIINLLNNSEYETIGLRGVEWVWNQDAERLGLSGKGSGVVAQEVELLYPWAVTEGYDGYKRVNYPALRLLILVKKFRLLAEYN